MKTTTPRTQTNLSGLPELRLPEEGQNDTVTPADEEPSSFSRVPLASAVEEPADESGVSQGGTRRRKKGQKGAEVFEPHDAQEITRANLAAASIVGVVGYGPGTGGGSGIRRHTPSCDFCKRRKERCIGGPPCQSCSNRNIECTFNTVNKAHFARKKPKLNALSQQDLQQSPVPITEPPPGMGIVAEQIASQEDQDYHPSLSVIEGDKPIRVFKKRGKVSDVACIFCRDRRKKCSAERPTCSNCFKRGVECQYPEVSRQRRGGRRRKDAEEDGEGEDDTSALHIAQQQPQHVIQSLYRGEPPVYHPNSCHFCKEQDLPCDRTLPGCINCGRRSQPCFYDPLEDGSEPSGLAGVPWPPPPHPSMQRWPAPGQPPKHGDHLPIPGLPMPGALPFYDVQIMAQLAEFQAQQGNPSHPGLAAMYHGMPIAMTTAPPPGKAGDPSHPAPSPFLFPASAMYDPAVTAAAFAQAAHMQAQAQQAFAQAQAQAAASANEHGLGPAALASVAREHPSVPDGEVPGLPLSEVAADEPVPPGDLTTPDGQVVHEGHSSGEGDIGGGSASPTGR